MLNRVLTFCICCLVALPVSAADELWEWVTPWPQGHSLSAAAAGNGVTVAVGEKGTVITSVDGIEWRTSHTGADFRLLTPAELMSYTLFKGVGHATTGESGRVGTSAGTRD